MRLLIGRSSRAKGKAISNSAIDEVLKHVYGSIPPEAVRTYVFFEHKLPPLVRPDFLSMVTVELLADRRAKCVRDKFLPVEDVGFRRVLERVIKRIKRAAIRLGSETGLISDPREPRQSVISEESAIDFKAAVKSLDRVELRILRLRMAGHSLKEIASTIGISTTESHRRIASIIGTLRRALRSDDE